MPTHESSRYLAGIVEIDGKYEVVLLIKLSDNSKKYIHFAWLLDRVSG
jgi:hypothetical protein